MASQVRTCEQALELRELAMDDQEHLLDDVLDGRSRDPPVQHVAPDERAVLLIDLVEPDGGLLSLGDWHAASGGRLDGLCSFRHSKEPQVFPTSATSRVVFVADLAHHGVEKVSPAKSPSRWSLVPGPNATSI